MFLARVVLMFDLLSCSCPYQDDRYLTTLIPVDGSSGLQFPTHHKRFVFKMFTFVEPTTLAPLMETVLLSLFLKPFVFGFTWSKICSLPGLHSLQYISLYPNCSGLLCSELPKEEWVLLLLNSLWHTWALFWLSSLLQGEMLGHKQMVPVQLFPVEKLSSISSDSFCNKFCNRFWNHLWIIAILSFLTSTDQ